MRILVVTPTRLPGGLDVNYASLVNQSALKDHQVTWLILDELFDQRVVEVSKRLAGGTLDFTYQRPPARRDEMVNNLASCYNVALDMARRDGFDMVVSMQDYFWVPQKGLQRFIDVAEEHPHSLISAFASLSSDPGRDRVRTIDGGWSIFMDDFDYDIDRPLKIEWPDCRQEGGYGGMTEPFPIRPIGWELNWAAIAPGMVHTSILFDTAYERGIAYDNQDFALRAAMQFDAELLLDPLNHVIGLPHKAYFPRVVERESKLSNMEFHLDRWKEFQGQGI